MAELAYGHRMRRAPAIAQSQHEHGGLQAIPQQQVRYRHSARNASFGSARAARTAGARLASSATSQMLRSAQTQHDSGSVGVPFPSDAPMTLISAYVVG